jgi:hypothetical protein
MVLATLLASSSVAHAHAWYPFECCSGDDCSLADIVVRRDDGSYLVTARHVGGDPGNVPLLATLS